MGTVCPDVRGMCQRPGVRTDLHMFVVWATASLLGATCGVDLDRPIIGEPTLVARSVLLPASGFVDDISKSHADRNIDFEYIQGLIFLS